MNEKQVHPDVAAEDAAIRAEIQQRSLAGKVSPSAWQYAQRSAEHIVEKPEPQMTRDQAIEVIKMFQNWNYSQRGFNDTESRIYDERRALILKAHRVLNGTEGK